MRNYLPIIVLLISIQILGQNNQSTIQKIEQTIQNYYDGYIYRDLSKLNQAFDTINGTMKVPVVENGKTVGYTNRFFKELLPKWGNRKQLSKEVLNNCDLHILNIDVVDNQIASAKIKMKVDTITYIDILSLEVMNDEW